jgi:phage terminase small subunit
VGYCGPIPKATVLEIAEGGPGKRRVNRDQLQRRQVAPKCPAHLDETARKNGAALCRS